MKFMPKKNIVKILDPVPVSYLNKLEVQNCNLTTLDKETYNSVSSDFLPSSEGTSTHLYGQGALKYAGLANSNETKVIGEMKLGSSSESCSYLIRADSPKSLNNLNQIVKSKSPDLGQFKVSKTEAIGAIEIPSDIDVRHLLADSIQPDRSTIQHRYKPTVGDNTFTIGSKSSKLLTVTMSKIEGSNARRNCLSIYTKVAETSNPSFMKKLAKYGLGLEDIHGLVIRQFMKSITDCDLKTLLTMFVSKTFYLPSESTLARKEKAYAYQSTKVRYMMSAFNTALKVVHSSQLASHLFDSQG